MLKHKNKRLLAAQAHDIALIDKSLNNMTTKAIKVMIIHRASTAHGCFENTVVKSA